MSHEVGAPIYEVVGPLERFDERDNVFARERLTPGSPEERAYHALHPELVEVDGRLAAFIEGKADAQPRDEDWMDAAFYSATFGPIAALAQPDMVDGPVSPQKVEADLAEMAQRVKRLARYLGANLVRIGPLNPAWVYSHRGCPPFFEGWRPYRDPSPICHQHGLRPG